MDLLTKQTVIIDIKQDGTQYSMEFVGCKFLDVYNALKLITMSFESGEIFENELRIGDSDTGEPISIDECRAIIQAAKDQIESSGSGSLG